MKIQAQLTTTATVRLVEDHNEFRVELDMGNSACSIFDELSSDEAAKLYERVTVHVQDSKRALTQLAVVLAEEYRHVR